VTNEDNQTHKQTIYSAKINTCMMVHYHPGARTGRLSAWTIADWFMWNKTPCQHNITD